MKPLYFPSKSIFYNIVYWFIFFLTEFSCNGSFVYVSTINVYIKVSISRKEEFQEDHCLSSCVTKNR